MGYDEKFANAPPRASPPSSQGGGEGRREMAGELLWGYGWPEGAINSQPKRPWVTLRVSATIFLLLIPLISTC